MSGGLWSGLHWGCRKQTGDNGVTSGSREHQKDAVLSSSEGESSGDEDSCCGGDENRKQKKKMEDLHVGSDVQIHSLACGTEHNGSRGKLLRFDLDKGRWDVAITIGLAGKVLALRPANLSLVMASETAAASGKTCMAAPGGESRLEVGALVRVHALTNAPEHNGLHGLLENFDAGTGRWKVKTVTKHGPGKTLALKPTNLIWMLSAADKARGASMRPPKGTE